MRGFNDAPWIVETVPIVVTAIRGHGQGNEKIWPVEEEILLLPENEIRGETKERGMGSINEHPGGDSGFVSA